MTDRELSLALAKTAETLASLAATLAQREPPPRPPADADGELLTPAQVAEFLRLKKVKYVYSLAKAKAWQPYRIDAGKRCLRFKRGLLDMLKNGA
jgi:hypothetical protein